MLLPAFTSSSGTPRSIASLTRRKLFGIVQASDVAERLLDVGAAQAGPEQALLEAVDDHLRAAARRAAARGSR